MNTSLLFTNIKKSFISLMIRLRSLPVFTKKHFPKYAFIGVGIIVLIVAFFLIKNATTKPPTETDTRVAIQDPKKSQKIDKFFEFPIKDDRGKEVTKLRYTIESADLRDEIIVKGQRILAVKGKTFLVLTIKIDNSYEKSIDINARDYVRLIVNGNDKELLAADIHNDPVSVQAISTKYTRIGFPVVDTQRKFSIQIGEIKGDKESIALEF